MHPLWKMATYLGRFISHCALIVWLWFLLLQVWFAENKGVLKARKIRLTFIMMLNQIDWQNYENIEIKTEGTH